MSILSIIKSSIQGKRQLKKSSCKTSCNQKERTVRCKDCKSFEGFDPRGEGPMGWCAPKGEDSVRPCMPWEIANDKPCFYP